LSSPRVDSFEAWISGTTAWKQVATLNPAQSCTLARNESFTVLTTRGFMCCCRVAKKSISCIIKPATTAALLLQNTVTFLHTLHHKLLHLFTVHNVCYQITLIFPVAVRDRTEHWGYMHYQRISSIASVDWCSWWLRRCRIDEWVNTRPGVLFCARLIVADSIVVVIIIISSSSSSTASTPTCLCFLFPIDDSVALPACRNVAL